MSLIILPGAKKPNEEWAYENGKEVLWFDENPVTHRVVLTSPMTPPRFGFNRHRTNEPKQMDRIFKRLNEQEHEDNAVMVEKLYNRGRAFYEAARSRLTQRLMSVDCKEWEKAFIREALHLMDERDHKMQQNTVYGVSAMEATEAPIEGTRTRVN
jgi:hypothetical protein